MRNIFNGIKIMLAIVCLIAAVAIFVMILPSLFGGESGGGFSFEIPGSKKVMLDVEPVCQFPDYPTGCESVSLMMLLRYYGVDVDADQIIAVLPQGEMPYSSDGVLYGADPEKEFVGSPYDKKSYGVFNGPIADTAEVFMEGVKTEKKASIFTISKILKSGNPVMAWYTSHPDKGFEYNTSWYTEDGKEVKWPSGEHAVVVCGEDLFNIYYADPNVGEIAKVSKWTFAKYFKKIGGRIVYYEY